MMYENIEVLKNHIVSEKEIILYHGSREGVRGQIRPTNRRRENGSCDFGQGFYMGTNEEQAESFISGKRSKNPVVYELRMDFSKIPEDKVLFLDDKDWLYTILAFRNNEDTSDFSRLGITAPYIEKANSSDVIIGYIADDRMQMVTEEFINNTLSDKGLYECLRSLNYGYQVVAKTELACGCIDVINEHSLFGQTRTMAEERAMKLREANIKEISLIRIKHHREGRYFFDIIDDFEQNKCKEQER